MKTATEIRQEAAGRRTALDALSAGRVAARMAEYVAAVNAAKEKGETRCTVWTPPIDAPEIKRTFEAKEYAVTEANIGETGDPVTGILKGEISLFIDWAEPAPLGLRDTLNAARNCACKHQVTVWPMAHAPKELTAKLQSEQGRSAWGVALVPPEVQEMPPGCVGEFNLQNSGWRAAWVGQAVRR